MAYIPMVMAEVLALIKVMKSEFLYSVPNIKIMRPLGPEFALLGRSNVGKSSLINSICQKKDLAKTSKMPGRTRHAVVYRLALSQADVNQDLVLVDLPGFGYANMSKVEAGECEELILSYLQERQELKHVFLLLDIRRKPDERERHIISMAAARALGLTVVLTKADKLPISKLKPTVAKLQKDFGLRTEDFLVHTVFKEEAKEKFHELLLSLI